MNFFDALTLIGGLALFLFGMNLMGSSLEKRAGYRLKGLLAGVTSNPIKGILLGAGITALMQSSSVTTVMVVGFVNSGIMTLSQSVSIIIGANLGAAVTPWILSLSGVSGGSVILELLKPTTFTPVLALIGVLLHNFSKSTRKRETGLVLLGFAILMYGMEIMSGSVAGLRSDPSFTSMMAAFSNPILGVVVGIVVTMVIQSSSASIGILQALSATGAISVNLALPVIAGQNIGTCVSAMLSSLGTSKNARRAAAVHLLFNLISMLICLPLYFLIYNLAGLTFGSDAVNPVTIAIINSAYKLVSVAIITPASGLLTRLATLIIPDKKDENDGTELLDERLMNTPSVAIERARMVTLTMAELAAAGVKKSLGLLRKYDEKTAQEVIADESRVDYYEDKLGSYLVKLSGKSMLRTDGAEVSELLRVIGDFERISDHSVNILKSAQEMRDKGIVFSEKAAMELRTVASSATEAMDLCIAAFRDNDLEAASKVEPLVSVSDDIAKESRAAHIDRLRRGECTIELGFILNDLLADFERIGGHSSNIAGCVLEISHDGMELHRYLRDFRHSGGEYDRLRSEYSEKYKI